MNGRRARSSVKRIMAIACAVLFLAGTVLVVSPEASAAPKSRGASRGGSRGSVKHSSKSRGGGNRQPGTWDVRSEISRPGDISSGTAWAQS